jgi:thioredoxin reductase (NADPH)
MTKPVFLVVDNDKESLGLLVRDLERRYSGRYRIIDNTSANEALNTLQQLKRDNNRVVLILVAQRMPQMTGADFLKQAAELFPDAKRVILSSQTDAAGGISFLKEVSVDVALMKPCQPPSENLYPILDDLLAEWEMGTQGTPPTEHVVIIGYRFSPDCHDTRDFLVRHGAPFEWLEIERDEKAKQLLVASGLKSPRLPVVMFPDGAVLIQPTNREIAEKIGLQVRPTYTSYDLVIIGAGPAGLAAAVYGASEGLRTVMMERYAPGGQAALSAKIENYLGFPAGLSGAHLAQRAVVQAKKFDAEIVSPQVATGVCVEGSARVVHLSDGSSVRSEVVLLATGVEWRRLEVPGIDRLIGAGVYYGGTLADASFCRNEDIYIVGGANSAGQAAVAFSRYVKTVTMLVRGDSLSESMSQYLIKQIETTSNIVVRCRCEVVEVHGKDRLEEITIHDRSKQQRETAPTHALFIFIGGLPHTDYLRSVLELDDHGFILTGPDLEKSADGHHRPQGWPLDRDPFWLECSVPGIFAVGDVRHGSVKRVAASVGEGATAVLFIHRYLNSNV